MTKSIKKRASPPLTNTSTDIPCSSFLENCVILKPNPEKKK